MEREINRQGICTAEEYSFAPEAGEHVVELPSGKKFLLRYPRLEWKISRVLVSQSIVAVSQQAPESTSDPKALAEAYYAILCEVCMSPRVSMDPQKGEMHPDRFSVTDAIFIARWAGGEVDAQGSDLARFRKGEPRSTVLSGKSGADVPPVAKRPVDNEPVPSTVQHSVCGGAVEG